MKKLKKILLINWLYFGKEVIDVGDINFLTGKNGAGKSTVIDALQIVLLGETNERNFNQAANEKSQRTLDSYMSCNLDHVLYDKLNTSDKEKEENSYRFAVQYRDRVQEFKAFFSDSDFSVVTGYKESWTFIKHDLHSLERHTNFALYFPPDSSGSSE